jgi:hypothetical protein
MIIIFYFINYQNSQHFNFTLRKSWNIVSLSINGWFRHVSLFNFVKIV